MTAQAAGDALPPRPVVTVVIPTWNRAALAEKAARSVLAQTYGRLALVVVDDGSADGTAARLRALDDERLRVVESPHLGHIGRLRNLGVRAGSGELVAFLDSDDAWLPGKLEAQVDALRRSGAGWCYTDYELMDEAGAPVPRRGGRFVALDGHIARDVVEIRADVTVCSVLVRRDAFDAVGGFSEEPALTARGDWEFNLRLATHADAVAVPVVLLRVLEHAGRMTRGVMDPYERTALAYEVYLRSDPPRELARAARQVMAHLLADAGAYRLARREAGAAAGLFLRSLRHEPKPFRWMRSLASGARAMLRPSG
jgi:GT2 family glycosyltransferase